MRRLFFVVSVTLLLITALVPAQGSAAAVGEGERLTMFGKHLLPNHSGVGLLIQVNQPTVAEESDESNIPWAIIIIVLVVLFLIVAIIVIGVTVFLIARKRSKTRSVTAGAAAPLGSASSLSGTALPASSTEPPSTPPAEASAASSSPSDFPPMAPQFPDDVDRSATIDLSRTVAITPQPDTAPMSYGTITFVSGALNGQKFDVLPDGACIGRDASSSQIVIADPRISKRHVWIGVRSGRVVIEDQSSRNGTFLNDPKSERITENALSDGDTVILGESDVARFEYRK